MRRRRRRAAARHRGLAARLRPAHGVDVIVLAGVDGRTLAFAPGHAAATALPGTAGAASLVLLTCYPFDAVRARGPLRYAVVAE